MASYVIGDLQGCYQPLLQLLDKINFNTANDRIWFLGDLVNRGPESLACLRFIKSLGSSASTVLGNHDLHLLAVAHKLRKAAKTDSFEEIIAAADVNELLAWLRKQPLLIHHNEFDFTMVHAGLAPQWSLQQAHELAQEVELLLKGEQFYSLLHTMYSNQTDIWSDKLTGIARYQIIINCFTRIRYCSKNGHINMQEKGAPGTQSPGLVPWYAVPSRKTSNNKIIFGHWSTIHLGHQKNFKQYRVYPLDTGCLWGGKLTAMRLEDERLFSTPC